MSRDFIPFHASTDEARRTDLRTLALKQWRNREVMDARADFRAYVETLTPYEQAELRKALIEQRIEGRSYATERWEYPQVGVCGCIIGTVAITRVRLLDPDIKPDDLYQRTAGSAEGNLDSPLETLAFDIYPHFGKNAERVPATADQDRAAERTALFVSWLDELGVAHA